MKVTTYIAKFLKSKGIDVVFELQGGMITRIIDGIQKQGGITIDDVKVETVDKMVTLEDFKDEKILIRKGKKVYHQVRI